jgi:hypothetical protein
MSRHWFTVGVSLSCLLWASNLGLLRAERRDAEILKSRVYPPLTLGRRLSIDSFTRTTVVTSTPGKTAPECRLLLIVEDSCALCRKAASQWRDFFRTLPPARSSEIALVSLDGTDLADELVTAASSRFGSSTVRLVTDGISFPLTTGLVATPAALILDASSRITFAMAGPLTDDESREVSSILTTCTPPPRGGH